ncbi:MviM [Aspergillus parasiticus SU-1]|uniref:D-xylose 1-dehydrogenase (NADP(+), D-xylono-1,5-lactone-forming) n=1 Tax=Aspergillus parasiticus (strain ATCC 56775 / NRRL 5862 / SRRC 143 / SU-1) TaxID=1403190 RepID=A0A0F0I469_ASPPU|nr:MviM [Aspergillus parasiticus SU-1]
MSELPSIRWGIITTGLISSWFVEDLVMPQETPKVNHIIQAIGSSALEKGQKFAAKYCPQSTPTIYASYEEVYNDPNVDVVYIGTPHSFHKRDCLDAIRAGKPILCEKAFTLNAAEAREVFAAAAEKNVYVHEAMWLRHRPLVHELRRLLYEEKVIGDVFRTIVDFALDVDIPSLPPTSRYKDPALGAGSLLDLGVYALTWAMLTLDPKSPGASELPQVLATQTHLHGVEVTTGVLLRYLSSGRQGIVSSTTMMPVDPVHIARIQGTKGYIDVEGPAASMPLSFTVYEKNAAEKGGKKFDFPRIGRGYIYEADNTALDVLAGRKQNEHMPWSETLRVMEIMDEIRRQGGTRYPVDV